METHRRLTCLIGDPAETYRSVIWDRHANWRPTCLIREPSETNIPHCSPTCLIRDQYSHRRPTCLWRPIGNQHACGVKSEFKQINLNIFTYFTFCLFLLEYCKDSNQACRALVGLRLGISVSNISLIRHVCWSLIRQVSLLTKHVGLRWVVDQACRSPIDRR